MGRRSKDEVCVWDFSHIGDIIATYSGGPSLAGVPAGGRVEGKQFEAAVAEAWITFAQEVRSTATIHVVEPARPGQPRVIKFQSNKGPWAMYLDFSGDIASHAADGDLREEVPPEWLEKKYLVSELLEAQIGPGPYTFAPPTRLDSKLYHADHYPEMFAAKSTNFDYSGAFVEDGQLREKLLFEYKYAKSSGNDTIDGNAHERLSFQVLQYLEIALRYPACSLNVIAAQAFSEYRNKYHPSFNQQALRLSGTYRQVIFRYAACRSDYIALFNSFARYLTEGTLPNVDYRTAD